MASCQYYCSEDDHNNPFAFAAQPCTFPPGTDPQIINAFDAVDKDGSGFIDESELRTALTKCNQTFTARTVRFIMCTFSKDATRIGPRDFVNVFNALKQWKEVFCRTDRNRDGIIDSNELRTALNNLGFPVSPKTVNLMIATYVREKCSQGVTYDKFIECCIIVKGLSDKFKEQEAACSATFTYELFMQAAVLFTAA